MKYCKHCGATLTDDAAAFCSSCGTNQYDVSEPGISEKTNNMGGAALVTLCILTILGSVLGILRGLFFEAIASGNDFGHNNSLGYASAFFNVGTLMGAVLMLNRKLTGFWLYAASQIVCIVLVILKTAEFDDMIGHSGGYGNIALLISLLFIVPYALFLLLYFLLVKKHLR